MISNPVGLHAYSFELILSTKSLFKLGGENIILNSRYCSKSMKVLFSVNHHYVQYRWVSYFLTIISLCAHKMDNSDILSYQGRTFHVPNHVSKLMNCRLTFKTESKQ